MSPPRIAIIGAGVTGLTVARLLRQKGADVHVYEMEEKPGGLARSEVVDGFTYDISGGHVLFSKDNQILSYIQRLLGDMDTVETKRNTKIYYKGRFVKYPFENGLGDLPEEDRFECVKGYVEAHFKRLYEKPPAPENFKDWVTWRFGAGIAKHFMHPYNEKIWKCDLAEMGTEWVAGRVPDAPIDDVLRAALGISTEGYTHQAVFYYPRTGGYQKIADRLADGLRDRIRLKTKVESIRRRGSAFEVNGVAYDEIVNTAPLQELYRILEDPDKNAKAAADALRYTSMTTFLVGVDGPDKNTHSWIYLPHPENGPVNRVTHLSNYSPENAPKGKSSILAEMTYTGELKVDRKFANGIVAHLDACGIVDKSRVSTLAWTQCPYAYIVFDIPFAAKRKKALDYLDGIRLHSLGRFGRYEYLNIDQCLRRAFDFVKEFTGEEPDPPELRGVKTG